jgi:ankyrin repeat protein
MVAAFAGELGAVQWAVARGARVGDVDPVTLQTPLMVAAIQGNDEVVAWLLAQGASPNTIDNVRVCMCARGVHAYVVPLGSRVPPCSALFARCSCDKCLWWTAGLWGCVRPRPHLFDCPLCGWNTQWLSCNRPCSYRRPSTAIPIHTVFSSLSVFAPYTRTRVPQNKRTALIMASAQGHATTVGMLLKAGADASLKDKVRTANRPASSDPCSVCSCAHGPAFDAAWAAIA